LEKRNQDRQYRYVASPRRGIADFRLTPLLRLAKR
jgi:hypothetical protein